MRTDKGRRLEKHLDDYTVIDIETCGISSEARKKIIELSAIRVRGGTVVDEFSSLVNPRISIPSEIVSITGIDDSMVADALLIDQVIPAFLEFIGDDVIVGYNINTFDYNILYDLSETIMSRSISNDFVDVIYASKRTINGLEDWKQTTVCSSLGIECSGAHRALVDCQITKRLYDALYERYGETAFDGSVNVVDQYCGSGPNYSEETIQLKQLQSILELIIEDGVITEVETRELKDWMNTNIALRGNYPFDRVYDLLESVFADGIIDPGELSLMFEKFTEFTNPTQSTCKDSISVADKHFVITGEFEYGARSAVEEYIISHGGIVDGNVKKCTEYVVIGAMGSQSWKNGTYGGKIKKAMELKDKGQKIELISENDFFS